MKLAYIQMSGFRGFRDLTRIEIPSGFAVVVGPNGVGKSTLCDAVEFALTGSIRGPSEHREKGESIHDYLWWRGNGGSADNHVEIGFLSPDGAITSVRRSRTSLEVTPNARLEDLLLTPGPSLEHPLAQLCRTAILRDEEITRVSVDLRETERFEFVRASLGTADFRSANENARRVGELLKRQRGEAQRQYEVQRDRIAQLTTRLSQARTQAERVEGWSGAAARLKGLSSGESLDSVSLQAKAQREVGVRRQQIETLRRAYTTVTGIAAQLAQLATADHARAVEDLESQLTAVEDSVIESSAASETLEAELRRVEAQSPRNASLAQLVEHGARLGLQSGECPLCGTPQPEEHFVSHLQALRNALRVADQTLASLSREAADSAQRTLEASRRADEIRRSLSNLKDKESALRSEFTRVIFEVEALDVALSGTPEAAAGELAARIEQLQTEAADIERAVTALTASQAASQVLELEREIAVGRTRLTTAEKALADLTRAQAHVQAAGRMIGRVQGELVDEQLAALSPLLVELYERLRPHVDWLKVRYNLRGDVRRMLSLEVGSGLNPSFVFSSGQRRAAGLAFLIAIFLSRSWCRLRTLLLDDPVQHVDDYRALHLTEVLAAVRRTGQQVVCTVEDRALAELLARRLRSDFDDMGCLIRLGYRPRTGAVVEEARAQAPLTRQVLVAAS